MTTIKKSIPELIKEDKFLSEEEKERLLQVEKDFNEEIKRLTREYIDNKLEFSLLTLMPPLPGSHNIEIWYRVKNNGNKKIHGIAINLWFKEKRVHRWDIDAPEWLKFDIHDFWLNVLLGPEEEISQRDCLVFRYHSYQDDEEPIKECEIRDAKLSDFKTEISDVKFSEEIEEVFLDELFPFIKELSPYSVNLWRLSSLERKKNKEKLIRLRDFIREKRYWDEAIFNLIGRPALTGHVGEFIASCIFDIELEKSASRSAYDGRFKEGPLSGKTVNIKWYSKQERMLDLTLEELPDYYLVMTGSSLSTRSSSAQKISWLIEEIFLFDAYQLVETLKKRKVKIGIASSVPKHLWEEAMIYPIPRSNLLRITEAQKQLIQLFNI